MALRAHDPVTKPAATVEYVSESAARARAGWAPLIRKVCEAGSPEWPVHALRRSGKYFLVKGGSVGLGRKSALVKCWAALQECSTAGRVRHFTHTQARAVVRDATRVDMLYAVFSERTFSSGEIAKIQPQALAGPVSGKSVCQNAPGSTQRPRLISYPCRFCPGSRRHAPRSSGKVFTSLPQAV